MQGDDILEYLYTNNGIQNHLINICFANGAVDVLLFEKHIGVNFAHAATPARTFSHGVTGFQPHRHGAEPQWSEGLLHPSDLLIRRYSSGQ